MPTRFTNNRSKAAGRKPRSRRGPLGDFYADLNQLYRLHLARRALGEGEVRMKTRRERTVVLGNAFQQMHRSGLKLRRLKNFRTKHVNYILSYWLSQSLRAGTLATYISHLRTFCTWLDKPQLVSLIDEFTTQHAHLLQRRRVAEAGGSRQDPEVNVVDVLSRAIALDERFAAQLALIVVFGLRSMEAWLFRPHSALGCDGRLEIHWDTQGGRPRVIALELTPAHVAVLEWARGFAQTRWESMIPPGWTLQRWGRRFYRLCARLGLTRQQLGVTPQGFRHGLVPDAYAWLTDMRSAAIPGRVLTRDTPADHDARTIGFESAEHCDVPTSESDLTQKASEAEDPKEQTGADV